MKKIFTIVAILCISVASLSAQTTKEKAQAGINSLKTRTVGEQGYTHGLGIKGGVGGIMLNYKGFVTPKNFLDLGVNFGFMAHDGSSASAFSLAAQLSYNWNFNIAGIEGFYWYVGPGIRGGILLGNPVGGLIGVYGQIGLEYKFKIPLALSLDWTPGLDIGIYSNAAGVGFGWQGINLGIKYAF